MEPASDSGNHSEDADADDNVLQHLKLHLDKENRRLQEFKRSLQAKEEELATQSKTIEELRLELDKEKSKSSQLQDNLNKEKGRRLEVENRMLLFERDVSLAMKTYLGGNGGEGGGLEEIDLIDVISTDKQQERDNGVGVTTPSPHSSSNSVTMSMMNSVIQTGTFDPPPQQNLKRKLQDEEAGNDLQLKATPQTINKQVDIIDQRSAPKVTPKPSSSEQIQQAIQTPTATPDTAILPSPSESQSHRTPDLRKLPPLVFQFQATQIKIGMFSEGKPNILRNASGSEYTPFVVGITTEGHLEYGDEVIALLKREHEMEQTVSNFRSCFWVTNQLIKCGNEAWSATPKLRDGERHQLTVEFLIGFVLKNLKTHVEAMMNGSCSTAVITVPFWYSSIHRIQVKNGVKLAGFAEVFLINEAPAAAFACPSRNPHVPPSHNILILSENSHQIDASIYSYNPCSSLGAPRLIMIGHSGHYSQVGAGATTTLGIGERESEIVENICRAAIQNVEDQKPNPLVDTSPPVELITVWESKNWAPILEQVGKQFVTPFSNVDVDNEHAVVLGAASLSQKPLEIHGIISDKLAHAVMGTCDIDPSNRSIIPKETVGAAWSRIITHTCPTRCRFLKIFQLVLDCPVELFRITMRRLLPPSYCMVVSLSVSDEGIVKFEDLVYTSTSRDKSEAEQARVEDYLWEAPNLSLEGLREAKALLLAHSSQSRSLPNPVTVAKQALLRKCVKIQGEMAAGSLQLNSELAKDAFIKIMEAAVRIGRNPNPTLAEVQGEMDNLERLSGWASWSLDST